MSARPHLERLIAQARQCAPLPMAIGLSGLPPEAYENVGVLWPMVPREVPG